MRVETTRVAATFQLEHAAGFYGSEADLVAQTLPIVEAALARSEPVALAVAPATEQALHEAVGNGSELVSLTQDVGPDGASGQTLAAQRARELRELTSGSGGAVVIVEHTSALDGADGSFWTELDAAANIALADLPVSLTCFFPEMPLHLEITEGARRNHPRLLVGGELRHNPDHRGPRDVLAERPAPTPVLLGPPDVRLRFSAWQLHDVRAAVELAAAEVAYERARAEDVVLAVNEVATNAVEHGTTEADLSLWAGPDGLVCEVHDGGRLADPLPGLRAPHPSEARGRGVWIARQVCDLLHVWTDPDGTHVRMRAAP